MSLSSLKFWSVPIYVAIVFLVAFKLGYDYPRDLELESLKPIQFNYEITKDAAMYLLLRDTDLCDKPADDNEQGVRG